MVIDNIGYKSYENWAAFSPLIQDLHCLGISNLCGKAGPLVNVTYHLRQTKWSQRHFMYFPLTPIPVGIKRIATCHNDTNLRKLVVIRKFLSEIEQCNCRILLNKFKSIIEDQKVTISLWQLFV